jgi:glycosyltransferase involved in cell wall biosynthesis
MISVICPFYNEASIIEAAIRRMLANLTSLQRPWELIVVNDGSTDDSLALALKLEESEPNLRVLGYPANRGRGFALRTGIAAAHGDIVITTEIDCSWGDDIVHRLVQVLADDPKIDMAIASPNLPGGGYANVPAKRVWISRLGNILLRAALSSRITMFTGMTRAYRRARFVELPLDEDEKEFHLEVARKALAFGFRIQEVPALLTWQHDKPGEAQRKTSSRIRKLMRTHLFFSMLAAPIRYILLIAVIIAVLATVFLFAAIYSLSQGSTSAFYLLTSLSLYVVGLLVLLFAVLTQQNVATQQELWRIRGELIRLREKADA